MLKSNGVKRKRRGRPRTGTDPFVGVRLPPEMIKEIEDWRASAGKVSRSDAIRSLIEKGLAGSRPLKQPSRKAAAKASQMAAKQIDMLANPSLPDAEQRSRKRRLIKGPSEFREIRGDLPKPKG